jgi:hypothetical protein
MGKAGLKLWHDVTGKYDLRPDELRVLEDACRETALIDRMEAEARTAALMIAGSMGQSVVNPLFSELRQHRSAFAALMRQLKLPDEEPVVESENRSAQARTAAKSRWSVAHGKAS